MAVQKETKRFVSFKTTMLSTKRKRRDPMAVSLTLLANIIMTAFKKPST
jgi:hypothetical protein